MIKYEDGIFSLQTNNTEYGFLGETGKHLQHLYYGIKLDDLSGLKNVRKNRDLFELGNTTKYKQGEEIPLCLENYYQEVSSYGKGDLSEPLVEMVHEDGSRTCDFLFQSFEIKQGKPELLDLPSSYGSQEQVSSLIITLADPENQVELRLIYSVFEAADVITRSSIIKNLGENKKELDRLMSFQLDMDNEDFQLIHFGGAWAREMHKFQVPCLQGKLVQSSVTGTSSNRHNPFFIIGEAKATETSGNCYGFNLVYSGNHMEVVDVNPYGRMRIMSGLNPDTFRYELLPGEEFWAPEAVMTFSDSGFRDISTHMHYFVRNHIVRGTWQFKDRPVLLNSWEAAYFDINENKLLRLAKEAKNLGVETFVMDDGWFGERDDDTKSLGDWTVNKKKLPGSLQGLIKKVNALGLDFGIWVEPEMVSENSDCFNNHPDWAVKIPDKSHSMGRNQMLLDLTRSDVREYIIAAMRQVFATEGITYVKWDMNRNFSDVFGKQLPDNRQGEFTHRYVCGLYQILATLTKEFPDILFEGCSAGGNRFDLGMLCFMPQIWASDDTDAKERCEIQNGYSYGYPVSVMSAHVSTSPNHQTLRHTPLETRFAVASAGVLGYECNFCDMKKEELEAVKDQISYYKKYRHTLQFGDYYRLQSDYNDDLHRGIYQWITVAKDKSEAVAVYYQNQVIPNYSKRKLTAAGLLPDKEYHMTTRPLSYNLKLFGDLVNQVSPVHIKQDSPLQSIMAKVVKMSGEKEDINALGKSFCNAGVNLAPGFSGTGYNDQTAYFQDYGARIYSFELVEENR